MHSVVLGRLTYPFVLRSLMKQLSVVVPAGKASGTRPAWTHGMSNAEGFGSKFQPLIKAGSGTG